MVISTYSESFCTTKNFSNYCGVNVLEYKIDNASINPSNNCDKVFFWIPLFSLAGEEKCYICSEKSTTTLIVSLMNSKKKLCGRIYMAGKI